MEYYSGYHRVGVLEGLSNRFGYRERVSALHLEEIIEAQLGGLALRDRWR